MPTPRTELHGSDAVPDPVGQPDTSGDDRGSPAMAPHARPRLWRLARLEYDPVRQRQVLLYPEGAILLNDTGAEILALCDGTRTVAEIGALLGAKYETDVTGDVATYLARLVDRQLVQDAADRPRA